LENLTTSGFLRSKSQALSRFAENGIAARDDVFSITYVQK